MFAQHRGKSNKQQAMPAQSRKNLHTPASESHTMECKRCLEVALDQEDAELRHQQPIREGQSSQCGKSLGRASASGTA